MTGFGRQPGDDTSSGNPLLAGTAAGSRHRAGVDDDSEDITGGGTTTRRGARKRLREALDEIPRVKDTTGEKVMERFAYFLDK